MLKIGDFSMLSKISINMLRHYDEIDLLKPARIDTSNGYRYYLEEQLVTANRIQSLKAMGLSLAVIRKILSEYSDVESWKKYLQIQLTQKKDEMEHLQQQILMLNTALSTIEQGTEFSNCDIAIKEIPSRNVASYCKEISKYEDEGLMWSFFHKKANENDIHFTSPSYDIAIIHKETENGILVEIQSSVVKLHKDIDEIHFKKVPTIMVASMTFKGGYPQLSTINTEIAKWIDNNGYNFNGNIFNIYHVSPKIEEHAENMVTEVCFPIRRK